MKIIFLPVFAALLLSGCSNQIIEGDPIVNDKEGNGSLALDLECSSDLKIVETKATEEEIINGLSIDIIRPADGWKVNYTPFSEIKGTVVELGSGDYTITASSPAKKDVAFEQPIYMGQKDFTINANQVTEVDLECSISNMKVTINLSEKFVTELSNYTVTVANAKGLLSWSKTNSEGGSDFKVSKDGKTHTSVKAGYFTTSALNVIVNGHRDINNTDATTTIVITDVNPADHHIINLDAMVTGSGKISITVDPTVNDVTTDVNVPGFNETPVPGDDNTGSDDDDTGSDDDDTGSGDDNTGSDDDDTGDDSGASSTAPIIVWDANPTFEEVVIGTKNADLVVKAPEGISSFKVTIDSDTEDFQGAIHEMTSDQSATLDLVGDQQLIAMFTKLGVNLPTGDDILGKTQVDFPITAFLDLINEMYDPTSGDKHRFTLNVKDTKNQVLDKTVVFVSR